MRQHNSRPFCGEVPERPKGSDCKSDAKASLVRIQPSPPEKIVAAMLRSTVCFQLGGHSSVVEPQPSKLMMRVRFPLPAPGGYLNVRLRRESGLI